MSCDDRGAECSTPSGSAGRRDTSASASAGSPRRPLTALLADAGVASEEQLRLAVTEGMGRGERLGEVVLRRGWIDQAGLARVIARQWDLPHVDDDAAAVVAQGAGDVLPASDAERLEACVIDFVDGVPLVAVVEPSEERFANVRSAIGEDCGFAVVTKGAFERLLTQLRSDEADAEAPIARAAAESREHEEAERLIGELDAVANSLLAWAERLRRIIEIQRSTEGELAASRRQTDAVRGELANARATIEMLQTQLAQHRELVKAARAQLSDVARALEEE
jgi:type II secretion system (T2SS) protein E